MTNLIKPTILALTVGLGLPKYYKCDIDVDLHICEKYGNQDYIFLLRESGSLLFPLKKGLNPLYISSYFKDESAKFFHINANGTYKGLSIDTVNSFIHKKPSIDGCYISEQLIDRVQSFLTDPNVTAKGFNEAHIPTLPLYWNEWAKWFEQHAVMSSFLTMAQLKLQQLSK